MNKHESGFQARTWFMAAVLAAFLAGCGSGDDIFGTGVGLAAPPPAAPGGLGPASCAGPGPLDMGAAANFGVLVGPAGGATLTCALPLTVNGDVGAASQSCIPTQGAGFNNYTGTDAPYVAAKAAMLTAIACAEARPCDFNYAVATDFAIEPQPLAPGVHCVTGAMSVGSSLTLSNPGVYLFRSSGALTSAATITLDFGGTANATNTAVFWVPQGLASIGATNLFLGTIMPGSSAASTLGANVTLAPGRVFSNSDVTIGGTSIVTIP